MIYTSGTTGPPKGVMLSHGNLSYTSRLLLDTGVATPLTDVSLSYLPLSHIAEQMSTIHMPTTIGSMVYFAESLDKLAENIKEVRPTAFFGVRGSGRSSTRVMASRFAEVTGPRRRLLDWARGVCSEVHARSDRGQPISALLRAQYAVADRVVIRKIKAAVGFDRARTLSSGAAPIAPDVLAFFASIDLPLREIYGQSEDSGPTSYNLVGKTRIGSVGPPMPGVEVKIAGDGEILVRGANVFLGYYKDPEATAEALRDGWLCSGDLGALDAEGFLTITGRKKEIIITAGGKNIAPKNIEAALKEAPVVGEGGRDRRSPQVPHRAGHARRSRGAQARAGRGGRSARRRHRNPARRSSTGSTRSTARSPGSSRSRSSRSSPGRSASPPASSRRP